MLEKKQCQESKAWEAHSLQECKKKKNLGLNLTKEKMKIVGKKFKDRETKKTFIGNHTLIKWSEGEVWEIFPKLGIACGFLVLSVGLGHVKLRCA